MFTINICLKRGKIKKLTYNTCDAQCRITLRRDGNDYLE